jgi:hypothetical protein
MRTRLKQFLANRSQKASKKLWILLASLYLTALLFGAFTFNMGFFDLLLQVSMWGGIFLLILSILFFRQDNKLIGLAFFLLIGLRVIYFIVVVSYLLIIFDNPSREVCRFTDAKGDLIVITSRNGVWLDDVQNSYRTQRRYKKVFLSILQPIGSLPEVKTKHGIPPEYRCPGEK